MSLDIHTHIHIPGPGPRTLLLMHGTGGDERDLLPLARSLDPEASILSPRGNISENGALRFFRRLAEGVFDLADVQHRTKELATWLHSAIENYKIDPASLTAVGYSNGANTIAAMMLLHPTQLKRAILMRAMVTVDPPSPQNLSGGEVLLLNGDHDPIIPAPYAKRLAGLFTLAHAIVAHHELDCGHELIAEDLRIAHAWLRGRPDNS